MQAMRRFREALAERPDLVLWLIAAYYVCAVASRILRAEGLQNDEAEQLFQSQFLLLGYSRQPPFYNWLQAGVIHVIGPSIFALSLVKNLLLFLCCVFCGLTARRLVKQPALVTVAMLGVLSLPVMAILAQRDLTHAVGTLCAVSLFLLGYFSTLTRPSLSGYLLTGAAIGMGAIAKYNFVIVPVAALIAALPEAELRRRIFDWRLTLTIAAAALISFPHALWVIGHFDIATTGTLDSMRDDATGNRLFDAFAGLLEFVTALLAATIPTLFFFFLGFRGHLTSAWKASDLWTRVTGRMLVISLLLVIAISLSLGATTITQKWLSPFVFVLPLYLCLKLNAAGIDARGLILRFAAPVLTFAFGFISYLLIGNLTAPLINHYQKDSLPSVAFIRTVIDTRENRPAPAYIVAADTVLAGGARLAAPDARVLLPTFRLTPPLSDEERRGQGLVIWSVRHGERLPEPLAAYLAEQGVSPAALTPVAVDTPYAFSGGKAKARFAYAWIDGR